MELDTLYSRKNAIEQTSPEEDGLADNFDTRSIQTVSKPASSRVDVISVAAQLPPLVYGGSNQSANVPLTRPQKTLAYIQFITLCWTLFLNGWNDGSMGPLLPRIQQVYNVNFAVVSLIFVFACLGFIGGALCNIFLTDRFGFGKTMVLGSLFQIVGYSIQSAAPPFPVFVFGYTLNGIGIALQNAQTNGFVATLKRNPTTKLGFLHAAYGLGAFAAPLAATQFAQLPHWSFHFLISLGIAISNTIILISVFKLKTKDESFVLVGEAIQVKGAEGEKGMFKTVMRAKAVHLLAFFALIYVGVEVTIGGWIVTFITDVRGGGPSSGYISSGFFGGLCLGRVLLLWVNKKVGERYVLFMYATLTIALEFTIWFVPSLVGNAVAVSIIGLLLGPMYPIAMKQASRILPQWILTAAIGWIAGFGQAGSALLPFLTGTISQKHGIIAAFVDRNDNVHDGIMGSGASSPSKNRLKFEGHPFIFRARGDPYSFGV